MSLADALPLRSQSQGGSVADLQSRLDELGYVSDDPAGWFGSSTETEVRDFQKARGLRCDGVCGEQTWQALVEAGHRLGNRQLYDKRPMLRGDDVAELQRRLGGLGFDAGRVDGIFGPQTSLALKDFQRNVGLTVDAIVGPSTVRLLLGLSGRTNGEVVNGVRERQRLLDAPRTLINWRVVVGETGGASSLAYAVRRSLVRAGCSVYALHDPDESAQARQANQLSGQVYLGLRMEPDVAGCETDYFVGYDGIGSEGGRRLAEAVQATVPRALGIADLGVLGMRIPVLRETRMPAVLVCVGPPVVVVERAGLVASALKAALGAWVSAPCDEPGVTLTVPPSPLGQRGA